MLREYGRVRVRGTGMYGTIVDWRQGDPGCEVELDGWQHEGQFDGDRQFPYSIAVTDLEELIEVPKTERKDVFEAFDTIVLSTFCWMDLMHAPIIVIKRLGNSIEVNVQSCDYELNISRTIDGENATKFLSTVFATHADRWTEKFAPEYGVLDGYSWSLDVHAGVRYFTCDGENKAPGELVDLLYAVAEIGLPLAWNGSEILLLDDTE